MARHKKQSAAAAPDEQTVASKLRRPAIKWDHRKDKYLLLAVFAQQNTPAPDYKQLADALGSETYSPDAVKRRLLTLKEMAAAVIEDRHDRHEETAAEQSATEDDDIILVKETAVQAPKTTINGPPTPSSSQRQAQPRVQQVAPKANTRPPPSQPTNLKNDQNSQNTAPFNRQINNQMNHPHSRTRRSRRNRKTANQPSQVNTTPVRIPRTSIPTGPAHRWSEQRVEGMSWGAEIFGRTQSSSYSSGRVSKVYDAGQPHTNHCG